MYRTLDSDKIVATIDKLGARIRARFPDASLAKVCAELARVARESEPRAAHLARPNWRLRLSVVFVIALGSAAIAALASLLIYKEANSDFFGTLQGIDAAFNIVVLMGAALFFLVGIEARAKRREALADLHVLRSIVHVIDMHQLTKDPSALLPGATGTAASPVRTMSPFEIVRYLDYCSEMLSLTAKVAALYAQSSSDPVVIEAVNDLERLTTNLSQKIWQKITLVQSSTDRGAMPATVAAAMVSAAPARASVPAAQR